MEYALLFRQPDYDYSKASPEKLQELKQKWYDWITGIQSQGKLSNSGLRLSMKAKVLKRHRVITDGPFVEIKEILGSFIVIHANNMEEAVELASGCPAMDEDGSVEIREVMEYGLLQ